MSMTDKRLIAFSSEGDRYALPIGEVVEVISAGPVDPVHGGRGPLEGLMIYRETGIIPVFSLARILGRASGTEGKLVMIVQRDGEHLGFRVERILGVIPAPEDGNFEPAEAEPDETRLRVAGTLPYKGGRLLVLESVRTFRFDAA